MTLHVQRLMQIINMETDTARKQYIGIHQTTLKVLKWLRMQQLDNCQAESYGH